MPAEEEQIPHQPAGRAEGKADKATAEAVENAICKSQNEKHPIFVIGDRISGDHKR